MDPLSMDEPHVPFLTGLVNHGTNSYMNAVLQCLFHIQDLPKVFLDQDFAEVYGNSKEMQMVRAFSRILKNNYNNNYNDDTFWNFIQQIIQRFPQFKLEQQHDAYEFLTHLLRLLENEMSKINSEVSRLKNINTFDVENAYDTACLAYSMIKYCWIELKAITTCKCNAESVINSIQVGLRVEIDVGSSLSKCIADFFKPRKVEKCNCSNLNWDCNTYKCVICKRHTNAMQFRSIVQFPDILIVQLKLFSENEASAYNRKLHKSCPRIVKELELDMYADQDSTPELKSYGLFALCLHRGDTVQNGQFTSVCFNNMLNQWLHFDDDQVTEITGNLNDYIRKEGQPYILFYRAIPKEISCAQIYKGLSKSFSTFSIGIPEDAKPIPRESTLNVEQILALLSDQEPEATQILKNSSNEFFKSESNEASKYETNAKTCISGTTNKLTDSIDEYLDLIVQLPALQQKQSTPKKEEDSMDEYMDEIMKMPEMASNSKIVIVKGGAKGKRLELKSHEQCKPCYVNLGERVSLTKSIKPKRLSLIDSEKVQKSMTAYTTKIEKRSVSKQQSINATVEDDDVIEINSVPKNSARKESANSEKNQCCTIRIPLKAIKNVARKRSTSRIQNRKYLTDSEDDDIKNKTE